MIFVPYFLQNNNNVCVCVCRERTQKWDQTT